jgi:hypothetical protein
VGHGPAVRCNTKARQAFDLSFYPTPIRDAGAELSLLRGAIGPDPLARNERAPTGKILPARKFRTKSPTANFRRSRPAKFSMIGNQILG